MTDTITEAEQGKRRDVYGSCDGFIDAGDTERLDTLLPEKLKIVHVTPESCVVGLDKTTLPYGSVIGTPSVSSEVKTI